MIQDVCLPLSMISVCSFSHSRFLRYISVKFSSEVEVAVCSRSYTLNPFNNSCRSDD